MTLLARFHTRGLAREVAAHADDYAALPDGAERERVQLALLNERWAEAIRDVPYYERLSRERGLPLRWGSLDDFVAGVPPSSRETLQRAAGELTSTRRPPDEFVATGGSTARPVQIPRWNQERVDTRPNMWVGRSWYGVAPDDRLFLLWGHSHLLGTGLRGFVNARRRQLLDWLLGYERFSAYDISPEAMRRAVESLIRFRPRYVLGYSVALDRLARVASGERARLHALGLKTVVATAEGFPADDSAARIEDAFGCPVSMEYGAVEALGIAYTHPTGGYRLFWRSYLAEAERREGHTLLRLTSLYPRSLPLLRYEIGDTVDLAPGEPEHVVGLTHFERVGGRCNDFIELADGQQVHSEAISHAVRPCSAIREYQVVQEGPKIELHFVAEGELPEDQLAGIRQRLGAIHAELASIPVEPSTRLTQSIAGKTPMIVRRP